MVSFPKWLLLSAGAALLSMEMAVGAGGEMESIRDLSREYQIEVFTARHGLPPQPYCLLQTRDGYIWIGSWFGLARFDGARFTVFNSQNAPEICGNGEDISDLMEDSDGALWIATSKGVARYTDNRFESFNGANGFCDDRIFQMWRTDSGDLWFRQDDKQLWRWRQGSFYRYAVNNHVLDVREEPGTRTVLLGGSEGLQRLNLDTEKCETIGPAFPKADRIRQLFLNSADDFRLISADGLHHWRDKQWSLWKAPTGIPEVFLMRTVPGQTWMVVHGADYHNHRLFIEEDGAVRPVALGATVPQIEVRDVLLDRESNLWIASRMGLIRLQKKTLRTYISEAGGASDCIWSVCEDHEGRIWAGTGSGAALVQNGRLVPFYTQVYPIFAIYPQSSRRLVWMARQRGELAVLQDMEAKAAVDPHVVHDLSAACFYEDRQGHFWLANDELVKMEVKAGGGAFQVKPIQKYGAESGLKGRIICLTEDRQGNFWVGTAGGGLHLFKDGRFEALTTRDGLSDNRVYLLLVDSQGTLWVGTERGLNRVSNGRIASVTTEQGLFDNCINSMLEDDNGRFWIGCNRGIFQVARQDLLDVVEGKRSTVNCAVFGEEDGMLSAETNGEHQPCCWKSRDGKLWFATQKGVVEIDPRTARLNLVPPPVIIEEVVADGETIYGDWRNSQKPPERTRQLQGKLPLILTDLPAGRARVLQIQYTAPSFAAPDKVRFKYKLTGHDREWQEAGNRRVAYYTNLKPGDYQFEVTAANNHGVWSGQNPRFAFSVAPHFYQTWPFYVLLVCAFIGIAAAIHFWRLSFARRIHALERERALNLERARIARDMHDELGAGLTQIALLAEMAKEPAPPKIIGSKVRQLISGLNELIWSVDPKHDTLENVVDYICHYAETVLESASIKLRLKIPDSFPAVHMAANVKHHLISIVKEALTNILKHSAAQTVSIEIACDAGELKLSISDDGRGFQPLSGNDRTRSLAPFDSAKMGNGRGLGNMKERGRLANAEVTLETRANAGTCVSIALPLPSKNGRS